MKTTVKHVFGNNTLKKSYSNVTVQYGCICGQNIETLQIW